MSKTFIFLLLLAVLFGFIAHSYLVTDNATDRNQAQNIKQGMCAKLPMEADGIVRLSKIEVYPEHLEEYMMPSL